jgi:hypothetical protein
VQSISRKVFHLDHQPAAEDNSCVLDCREISFLPSGSGAEFRSPPDIQVRAKTALAAHEPALRAEHSRTNQKE